MELERSFSLYRESFYSRWQKNILNLSIIVAFVVFGIEIFTFHSLLSVAEKEFRKFTYICARIVIPSGINFGIILVTSFILKSRKVKTERKNFMVSFCFFMICSVLSVFHNYFQILLLSTCISLLLCSIFGDTRILKIQVHLIIPIFFIASITFWCDKLTGIPIYKILTIICAIAFISFTYVFARAVVISQKDQLKYIRKIYERQNELVEELRIDPLTKLCNRMAFNETISRIINLKKDSDISPFIVMMDIDFFKKVNDRYGHICGDEVLVSLANIMRSNVSTRKAFRFGGEEFILLFEDDNQERIVKIVEKIRQEFSEKVYDFAPDESFTISAGISAWKEGFDDKKWIEWADKALYFAKENGRDQIKIAELK